MSDHDFSDADWEEAQSVADNEETYIGSWEYRGQTLPLECTAPSYTEVQQLDEELAESNEEDEAIRFVNEYLVRPEIDDVSDEDLPKVMALFIGLQQTWASVLDTEDLEVEMPVEQGNG